MNKKDYTVIIQIDFNAIDCPGVWLCPKGKAFLKVCLFGIADLSRDVDPFFPLLIRERFIFEKEFKDISSVYELHDKIGRSVISIELLQCPVGSPACVKLAIFNSLLSDLLHPYSSCFARPPDTSGIELLFTTCKIFPGIIAPKADVSLKVSVSDAHGDGERPTVRRMPLKLRKGDIKRQQAVCHSKNGLNCGCFSHRAQASGEPGRPDSGEAGDGVQNEQKGLQSRKPEYRTPAGGVQNEPTALQSRKPEYRMPAGGMQNEPRAFQSQKPPGKTYRGPPPQQQPYSNREQDAHRPSQAPKKSVRDGKMATFQRQEQQPEYARDEPDMEWARLNLGVALGPGEYKRGGNEQNTAFSTEWEYVWDGDKKGQNILSRRRSRPQPFDKPEDKRDPMSGREKDYGDEAIRRQLEVCEKLMKDYTPDDIRNDPELKSKYDECVSNMEWLRKHGRKLTGDSSDKLMPLTDTEEPYQAMTQRQPVVVPCHGKCCKCEGQQAGEFENEGQSYQRRRTRDKKDKKALSPIDEDTEWFPRKTQEKETQRDVQRKKESVWERERITQEQDRNSRQQENEDRERRRKERERRRQQEIIRQREQRERMSRQMSQSSSEAELEESDEFAPVGELDRTIRPQRRVVSPDRSPIDEFAPVGELDRTIRPQGRVLSPDRSPKRTDPGKPRPSAIPRPSTIPGPTTKRPSPPQQPRSSEPRKPQSVPAAQDRIRPPQKSPPPDYDDSPEEDCDCDLCDQYQKLYNPSSHPCPRFRKTGKTQDRKQKNAGAKKLIASRKKDQRGSTNGPKNRGRTDGECGFFACDGPIDTEAIEEMNAIQKFYYGK